MKKFLCICLVLSQLTLLGCGHNIKPAPDVYKANTAEQNNG